MNRDNRSSSHDPTAEREADQSTQSAGGLSGGRPGPESGEIVSRGRLETPRRYDQPIEEDEDPVMPGDDPTLNTKI